MNNCSKEMILVLDKTLYYVKLNVRSQKKNDPQSKILIELERMEKNPPKYSRTEIKRLIVWLYVSK